MWKRLRASCKVQRTCSGQYTKIDFAGLHINYDHMWWFMAKPHKRGDEAIQCMVENLVAKLKGRTNAHTYTALVETAIFALMVVYGSYTKSHGDNNEQQHHRRSNDR